MDQNTLHSKRKLMEGRTDMATSFGEASSSAVAFTIFRLWKPFQTEIFHETLPLLLSWQHRQCKIKSYVDRRLLFWLLGR